MSQLSLFSEAVKRQRKLEVARIILADPERYPGLCQMCSRDVVERWEREQREKQEGEAE